MTILQTINSLMISLVMMNKPVILSLVLLLIEKIIFAISIQKLEMHYNGYWVDEF